MRVVSSRRWSFLLGAVVRLRLEDVDHVLGAVDAMGQFGRFLAGAASVGSGGGDGAGLALGEASGVLEFRQSHLGCVLQGYRFQHSEGPVLGDSQECGKELRVGEVGGQAFAYEGVGVSHGAFFL